MTHRLVSAAWASAGSYLSRKTLRPRPRPTESKSTSQQRPQVVCRHIQVWKAGPDKALSSQSARDSRKKGGDVAAFWSGDSTPCKTNPGGSITPLLDGFDRTPPAAVMYKEHSTCLNHACVFSMHLHSVSVREALLYFFSHVKGTWGSKEPKAEHRFVGLQDSFHCAILTHW